MLNEMKLTLLHPLNEQMDDYHLYYSKFKDAEQNLLLNNSENDYKEELKNLKIEYKKPKGEAKKEYELKKAELIKKYTDLVNNFVKDNEKYLEMKQKLANWNVYEIKKQMEKINKAKTIEDLGYNLETAKEFCNNNGIEFRIELDKI